MADVNVTIGRADFPELCWELDPACLTAEWAAFDQEVQNRAAMLSISSLRMLTAYRVGGCPITVRPCKPSCAIPGFVQYGFYPQQSFYPQNFAGLWTNGCGCTGGCGCGATCETKLPMPIGDVIEVKVDGVALPLTDFRVDNGGTLVYQSTGDCPFNMAQDLSKPDTEVGTWSVTYVNSYLPDATASYAAGILAMEFAKACVGGKCKLPPGVTEVVRNGVAMTITPGSFPDGFTGIREVDSFISLWKPAGSPDYAPRVYSPSAPQVRHTTRSFT